MSRRNRELACRRRLADGPGERWLWAVGSGLPWVGLAVLLLHGLTRRTLTPALYGLTSLAAVGFLILTLGGLPDDLSRRNRLPSGHGAGGDHPGLHGGLRVRPQAGPGEGGAGGAEVVGAGWVRGVWRSDPDALARGAPSGRGMSAVGNSGRCL